MYLIQIILLNFIVLETTKSDKINKQLTDKISIKARTKANEDNYIQNDPQTRRKRHVQNKGSNNNCNCNCTCGDGNGSYCKCVQNFLTNCFQNSFCNAKVNSNHSANAHLNRVFFQPMWFFMGGCCCCGNHGNRRKQFRDQCNCHYSTEDKHSNQNDPYLKQKNDLKLDKVESKKGDIKPIYTYSYGKSKKTPKTEDEFCDSIDVNKLYKFCKAKMIQAKNKDAQSRLDIGSIIDFCNKETQKDKEIRNKIKDKMKYTQNEQNRYKFKNRPSNKDFVRKYVKTPPLTRKPLFNRFTTVKEKLQKNTSQTLGDYFLDYGMGMASADLSSFGIQADSGMKKKVRKDIERNKKLKARQKRRRKQKATMKETSDDSYDMSLGLKFPISRDEYEIENDDNYRKSKEQIRNKPVMDQIFDSFSFTSKDEQESQLSKQKQTKNKNKTKRDENFERYENNNEKQTDGNRRSQQSFKSRRERFDDDESLDNAMNFDHSDDLLSFSI